MSLIGHYIGPTPITEYACVFCQKYHRQGIDPEYGDHILFQSKHGVGVRAPRGILEQFVAHVQAEERSCH